MVHVVTAKQISWEAIKINFFSMCQRKQKMTKKNMKQKRKKPTRIRWKNDSRLFGSYFEQAQVSTISKIA